jgi:putative PIN family toxin of toxin-antitoxin system
MSSARPAELRVVLDSNVLVSAFAHPERAISRLWREAVDRRYNLVVSPVIVREVARALRTSFLWEDARVIRRLKRLTGLAELVTPDFTLDVIRDDPDDNRIVECAVAGRADLIVSGDRDLTRMKRFQGIGIVTPPGISADTWCVSVRQVVGPGI